MKKSLHFEGLRGIAAFIVFIAHFRPTFCIDINTRFLDYIGVMGTHERAVIENFISLLYEGTLPVFIFWFMSAYVISIKLFDPIRNENNSYLVEVSTKRYFRLGIPIFFSSLLCFILMKSNLILNTELADQLGKGYKDSWLNEWFNFDPSIFHFLKTTLVDVFMPGNCSYNLALWTMNPELMGSFLCFGLFAVAGKNKYRFGLYAGSIIFLTLAGFLDNTCFYYLIFVLGITWCDAVNSKDTGIFMKDTFMSVFNSKWIAPVLLFIGFAGTIFSDTVYPIHKSLYYFLTFPVKAIGFTLLVNNYNTLRKLFSIKILSFMGKISFSFYLLHIPILFSLGIYLYMNAGIPIEYRLPVVFLSLTVVNIVVSYLFMKFIDSKAIKVSDRIGKYFSSGQIENNHAK